MNSDNQIRTKLDEMKNAPEGMKVNFELSWQKLEPKLETREKSKPFSFIRIAAFLAIVVGLSCIYLLSSSSKELIVINEISTTAHTVTELLHSETFVNTKPIFIEKNSGRKPGLAAISAMKKNKASVINQASNIEDSVAQKEAVFVNQEGLVSSEVVIVQPKPNLKIVHLNDLIGNSEKKPGEEVQANTNKPEKILKFIPQGFLWKRKNNPEQAFIEN